MERHMKKEDLINRLRKNPLYQAALRSVDDKQAKRIAMIAEGFLSQAASGLVPMIQQATDPKNAMVLSTVLSGSKVD